MIENKEIKLTSFDINEKVSIKGDTYYVITDKENSDNYFCFKNKLKEGWSLLTQAEKPFELNIEYEENSTSGKTYRQVIFLHDILI